MAWKDLPAKPNILLIITDQQRYLQHWPADWNAQHLRSFQRLLANGMSFTHAFSAACECSPSRGTFVTSTFDNTNRVFATAPRNQLPPSLPNLATVLASAGYQVTWKGKWHLQVPPQGNKLPPPGAPELYGFAGWNPPDAGTTLLPTLLGAGTGEGNHNDFRFVSAPNGAVEFLDTYDDEAPFCLIVSLVNPHDVHVYAEDFASAGFPANIPDMGVGLAGNTDDPLTEKPRAQALFRDLFDQYHPICPAQKTSPAGYVNFYAYLHKLVDDHICAVLNALDRRGFTNDTLIVRFGDHGEMGYSHGLREKMYVAYDEAIRVPFVVSNPLAFPEPVETAAFASLLDLVPTLGTIAGAIVPPSLMGKDLTPVLADPRAAVQDKVLYSYDDISIVTSPVATQIRALRTRDWMYSVYFSASEASIPLEFELYDLRRDPGQMVNLLNANHFKLDVLPVWWTLNHDLWKLADELGSTPPGFTPPGFTPPVADQLGKSIVERELEPADLAAAGPLVLDGK